MTVMFTNMYWIIFIALIAPICESIQKDTKKYDFELVYQWKLLQFKFESEAERSEALNNGSYKINNIRPIDAQPTYNEKSKKERIFITIPRTELTGTPATLGVVTEETRDGSPIIEAYPSRSWHVELEKCNEHRIVSVFRVWADECGRLWVMDNAKVGEVFPCTPQILAFDLETDTLLYKYELPYDQYQNVSLYLTPVAEIESMKDNCKKTWLYVSDSDGPRLLVYNLEKNVSWAIQDESFKPDPNYENYTIQGDSIQVADGILSVALSPKTDHPKERKLFYHSMSNIRESWVYLKDLKNPENFKKPYGSPQLFHTYPTTRDQQSPVEAIDSKGLVYFALLIDVLIVKWDPTTSYKRQNFKVIADNKNTMQFPTGFKIPPHNPDGKDVLWVFPTAYQKFQKELNGSEVNFRLFRAEL
ncbi:major royal jelly protein 1-like [Anthonomus grandis grandis]|uniref:major royal jelly protein 1-like n=1 Tax=Anthonomus grandis grandis TaxID=2921223 RepID=UPI002165887F|nr:major royal jelly protein 1-like [Anthonomus grandis grandis]